MSSRSRLSVVYDELAEWTEEVFRAVYAPSPLISSLNALPIPEERKSVASIIVPVETQPAPRLSSALALKTAGAL